MLKIVRNLTARKQPEPRPRASAPTSGFVCHCKKVPYAVVHDAIDCGARSIADLQRQTSACTHCFGCRFELEGLLRERLGDAFRRESGITLPKDYGKTRTPSAMYMPVLAGFGGNDVDTRVIVFNWEDEGRPAEFRADLLRPSGERVGAWRHAVARGGSAVVDLSRAAVGSSLPGGFGVVKLVLETESVGSLRPYFHFITPTGITTTHEKSGPKNPARHGPRSYHWLFPIGRAHAREQVYFFFVNTQFDAMEGQRLVWQSVDGDSVVMPLPTVEFDQAVLFPVHEHVPEVAAGTGVGSVRLDPAEFKVAGFLMRHDPERQLWRVQHL